MNTTAVGHLRPLLVPTLFEKVLPLPIPVIVPIMVTSRIERIFEIFKAMIGLPSSVNLSDSERAFYVVVTVSAIYLTHFAYRKIYGAHAKKIVSAELKQLESTYETMIAKGKLQQQTDQESKSGYALIGEGSKVAFDKGAIRDRPTRQLTTIPLGALAKDLENCVANLEKIRKYNYYLPEENASKHKTLVANIQNIFTSTITGINKYFPVAYLKQHKDKFDNKKFFDEEDEKTGLLVEGTPDVYLQEIQKHVIKVFTNCQKFYSIMDTEFPQEYSDRKELWTANN